MLEWVRSHVVLLSVASGGVGLLAVAIGLVGVLYIPADYFVRDTDAAMSSSRYPLVRVAMRVAKNVAGATMLAIGAVLSLPLVPGPGLLLILLGLSLMSFPGKRKLEQKIISVRWVLHPLNRLRTAAGREPLQTRRAESV